MDLDNLLLQALEIEGAIRVARDSCSPEARQLLDIKVRQFVDGYEQLRGRSTAAVPPPVPEPEAEPVPPVPELESEPEEESLPPLPEPESEPESEPEEEPLPPLPEPEQEVVEFDEVLDEQVIVFDEPVEASQVAPSAHKTHSLAESAFTVNDRYRFTAELFNGDSDDFSETVKLLGSMPGMDEVKDYLYNDLMWEPDDAVVKEFMEIVERNMR